MAERARVNQRRGESGVERQALTFVDHHRRRDAARDSNASEGEFLIGEYLGGGGVGDLGEFKFELHYLGARPGLLYPQLCIFDDGTGALAALLDLADGDLGRVLQPVRNREEFSARLIAFGLYDASDLPQGESR